MSQIIDKRAVADSFSKAAGHYDQFAQLQRDIGEVLLTNVENFTTLNNALTGQIVDLGCGTGYFSKKLSTQFPNTLLTCFDLSEAMIEQVKKHNISNVCFQQGDIDALPFKENSLDLIYSNLVVQWSNNLENCLKQIKMSLKSGGKCYLSTLINGTLDELTQAWKFVDENPHTNSFLTLQKLHNIVDECGFSEVKINTETRVLQYENVVGVMRALKGIGANHVHGHKKSQIYGRQLVKKLQAGYQPFMTGQGLLNLTYEVCYIELIK